jgi:poly-gamma-glutamate capsule biosynthesis protein CapA/YwtB (metallophosphatase superfamily)
VKPSGVAIGFLGDVMLGRMVAEALERRPPETVWSAEVRELASSLDLLVCNLECCISERGAPTMLIEGKPFFFRAPPSAIDALKAIDAGAVSLANNHALDFGPDALADTLDLLAAAGIAAVGGGLSLDAARTPVIVRAGSLAVGLVAVTDHPVEYAARPERPGVAYAPLGATAPDWLLATIAAARARCDLLVVVLHWGPNMTTRPAAWQRQLATALVEAGADLVAGHSAHVFHGVGWTGRPIVFDLGDALDDYRIDPELRNDLGVMAIWRPDGPGELELVGLELDYCHTRLAAGPDAEWIADRVGRACRELGTAVTRVGEQRFVVEPLQASSSG